MKEGSPDAPWPATAGLPGLLHEGRPIPTSRPNHPQTGRDAPW